MAEGVIEFVRKDDREWVAIVHPENVTEEEFALSIATWKEWLAKSSGFFNKVTVTATVEIVAE
jgi:hypothetical protein